MIINKHNQTYTRELH